VIGKDIVKFHAVYWPAMLMSANLPIPNKLFVHGFINVEGKKRTELKRYIYENSEDIR
jgi:methionyl-tRNA synthetase